MNDEDDDSYLNDVGTNIVIDIAHTLKNESNELDHLRKKTAPDFLGVDVE